MKSMTHNQGKNEPPLPPKRVPRLIKNALDPRKMDGIIMPWEGIFLKTFDVKMGGAFKSVQQILQNRELLLDIRVELLACEKNLEFVEKNLRPKNTPVEYPNSSKKSDSVDFEVCVLRFAEKEGDLIREEIQRDEAYSSMPAMRFVLSEIHKRKHPSTQHPAPQAANPSVPLIFTSVHVKMPEEFIKIPCHPAPCVPHGFPAPPPHQGVWGPSEGCPGLASTPLGYPPGRPPARPQGRPYAPHLYGYYTPS